jgi:hypothetical protein
MSCNCNNLPTIADSCATPKTTSTCPTCPTTDESLKNDTSEGTTLANTWLDSTCSPDELVILARKGDKLARFSGSGFIKIDSGLASVVTSIPLKVTTIYHNYWKQTAASAPIPGEPLPFKFQVVADCLGDLHAIQGTPEKDSLTLWDASEKKFVQTPVEEVPKCVKGLLPRRETIELVGYKHISAGGSTDEIRCLSTLAGEGIIVVNQVDTVADPADPCDTSKASVASFLANPEPEGSETYTLKFSTALGIHWSQDA